MNLQPRVVELRYRSSSGLGNRLEQPAQEGILSSYKIVPVRLFAEAHVFITRRCVCMLRFSRLEGELDERAYTYIF